MRTIFVGPGGIRAGWRLLLFFCIVFIEALIVGVIVHFAFPQVAALAKAPRPKTIQPSTAGFELLALALAAGAAFVMSKIEHRPFAAYGLPLTQLFQRRFWRGALWGFVAISAVVAVMFVCHGFRVTGLATHGRDLAIAFAAWTVAFLLVGLSEEFTFRGYPQFTLTTGIGFWPAAVLLSLAFAAAHLGNQGESPLGIAEVALFGLVFCFVLQRTGNLWWGVGFHASWDWGETFFYGVRDSGMAPWHPLLASQSSGPVWLTGGTAGPEGSVLTVVALLATALLVARAYPREQYTTAVETIP